MSPTGCPTAAQDGLDIATLIASQLAPLPLLPLRRQQLGCGVIERARRSVQAHRSFTTVRREDADWTASSPGVRQSALSAVAGMRVDLLQLAPGATLPWPRGVRAQEVLVLGGALDLQAPGLAPYRLCTHQQAVMARARALCHRAGDAGASLYVRSRLAGLAQLPAAEAQWWRAAQRAAPAGIGLASAWAPYVPGVDAAVLQAHGEVASMLVTMDPGATVPDHGHGLDEDCLMLEGEMFLGDVLMRAGDYQRAAAGCRHVGIASDGGGLFYFHGAIPPAASGEAQ